MGFFVILAIQCGMVVLSRLLAPRLRQQLREWLPSLDDEDAWIVAGGTVTFEEWTEAQRL